MEQHRAAQSLKENTPTVAESQFDARHNLSPSVVLEWLGN
jgi:hypothetical protein